MSLNREKYSNFFPSKVYRCPCLLAIVDDCFENDFNSFIEIHDEIQNFTLNNSDIGKVVAIKCGEQLKTVFLFVKNIYPLSFSQRNKLIVLMNRLLTTLHFFITKIKLFVLDEPIVKVVLNTI